LARKARLPKHVTRVVDRHSKERFRYRRGGIDFYLTNHPESREGKKEIDNANQGLVKLKERVQPRTVGYLLSRFYTSARFQRGGENWRAIVKATLNEFHHEFKDSLVEDFRDDHIETLLVRRAERKVVEGRRYGGPAAAERLREQLIRLFEYAEKKLKWIDSNPAREADSPVTTKGRGYHTWTVGEIDQFQRVHKLGTKARLAMEIAFWTGLRRGDVAKLGPDNVKNGRITAVAGKTTKDVDVMIAPALQEAIGAMPRIGETFLETSQGKPFSDSGLGNWFRDRCNEAGLPHCSMHGLRKALTTIAAESGATQRQLKALGQWSNDAEVATYTAKAEAKGLADGAIALVIEARKVPA
jgi:integrase